MKQTKSIPDSVLDQIRAHRPHLGAIIDNLNAHPERAMQFERPLANAYLAGETRLSVVDTWKLSSCCVSKQFGEY